MICDDSNDTEGEIFRRMNTGTNSKEMMRRVRIKVLNNTSVISYLSVLVKDTGGHDDTTGLSHANRRPTFSLMAS